MTLTIPYATEDGAHTPLTLNILTPAQAHAFAAQERATASQEALYAERLQMRADAIRRRVQARRANADRFDAAARGEWE